jgi:hypothetical protein
VGYLAPEYLLTGTEKIDVLSYEAVVLEVARGRGLIKKYPIYRWESWD